jgi:sugar/nucleoside kinase (ribokinase family)
MEPGGAYNSAVAMHRLGLKVGWAADFGNDDFSRFVLSRVHGENLDESFIVRHERPMRSITVAASYPEERAFIAYYDPEPAVLAGVKALARGKARVLYLAGLYAGPGLEAALLVLKAKKMALVMDGNSHQELSLQNPAVKKVIQHTAIFMPNAREAKRICQEEELEAAIRKLGEYCPLVVVKDGGNGAYGLKDGCLIHSPALRLKPLDTTGAGDCFNAGFLKAWMCGMDLDDCLRWGNIVGGLSTQGPGGTGKRVTVDEITKSLA